MTRFLHVANGTSTTRTIEAAGLSGRSSIWADPLYEGPVPAGLSDAELVDVRSRYLAGQTHAPLAASSGSNPSPDRANDLREWRHAIERHESYDELILWFEHDLFDQLNLIQLLAWIHERLPATRPVTLVCIGSFPGRPRFKGLGELTPGELVSLLPTAQRVGDSEFRLAVHAWDAFRAPTPEALDALVRRDTSALPYLAAAMARFLEEYPWTRDGLSRSEHRLLELAGADGIALSNAFPRMHEDEDCYYITDLSLVAMAQQLSRTSPPLVTLDSGGSAGDRIAGLRGSIALTDAGRAVLAGERDRITLCGIDRWLGGVHVRSGGRIWRWDHSRQRVI